MSERNKAVVRRFTDLWNTGDLSSVDELIAPGYRQHSSQLDPFEGVDALAEMIADRYLH